jgi:DNA repair protein RecN (Recombination protein N)
MLRFLRINRLAVIDAVEIEFGPGLNVLTGETGAGKSMLVEAVGLLLGGRASPDLVRTGEETATIEAIFERDGVETLVRREVTAQGRSRAFVNGELATAGALKALSSQLVELHGQHEHHTLLDPAAHLPVVDEFGAHDQLLRAVGEAFEQRRVAREELARLRSRAADRDARLELARFQLGDLEKAALDRPDEDVELAASRKVLASAERVERLCQESYAALYEHDHSVLAELNGVWKRVSELAALDPEFQPYLEARDGLKSQLEDLALFLRRYADGIEASPARLQQIEERLALLERLKRKYGPTLGDVVDRRNRLAAEVADLDDGAGRLAALERDLAAASSRYLEAARTLSAARRRVAEVFSSALVALLAELAMDRTRLEVRFAVGTEQDETRWTATGLDTAELYFSPNPGEDLRPLARIASGGELSRVMLAIKTLTATSRSGFSQDEGRPPSGSAPGLVFDEVDAGIGGRVADVVGAKLRALGSAFQVLCITHLPQIAARADRHFHIEKRVDRGRTRTRVTALDAEARVEEIARMLGGAHVTDAIRASAGELLARKAKGESERAKVPGSRERPAR